MTNDLGALLSGDIPDPVAFFLEGKVDFLHQLGAIAPLLSLSLYR